MLYGMHALNSDTPVQSHLSNHPIHDLVSAAKCMTVELRVQYVRRGDCKLETVWPVLQRRSTRPSTKVFSI